MVQNRKKGDMLSQIIVTVAIALLVGGTAPWWWEKIFPGGVNPPSPPAPPVIYVGPVTVTASTDPPAISNGQQTSINVYVQDSQGRPFPSATVTLSSGGGRFSQSGTTAVSGTTDSLGSFRAFWSCDPCAPGYVGGVRVTREGYEEAVAEWQVHIR